MSTTATNARMLATTAPFPRVPEVRMPNQAWLDFLSKPELSPEDWALIGRVERGEIEVDAAMKELRK